jgi:hypothetical protein
MNKGSADTSIFLVSAHMLSFSYLNLAQICSNLLEWLEGLRSEPGIWQGLLPGTVICARNVSLINRHKY